MVRIVHCSIYVNGDRLYEDTTSLSDAENWLALGTGGLLLLIGASRRSAVGALVAASSAPLLYRGITGHWPADANGSTQPDHTKRALGGERGVHVRESIRLEVPLADAYSYWRRLENLPRFMTHPFSAAVTMHGQIISTRKEHQEQEHGTE